ncbi:MAG: protein kinase [Propionibacteriaceae bacterium]|jgi:serine/threonine protein kinase|nr:protein kinase [Propionibacteriaceae bacterium]
MTTDLLGDRYQLGTEIGYGAMGDVYSARDTVLKRDVAVKRLSLAMSKNPSSRTRFRREAEASAGLNHPNIVTVHDTGEYFDHASQTMIPYIVMELVEGHTLQRALKSGHQFTVESALEITQSVLKALNYSHSHGIVHRDIKPANVMLTKGGQIKVLDFGIAQTGQGAGEALTETAAVLGTPQYLSPEQAHGKKADARSDLYSVGCLLYELLTSQPPFTGESTISIVLQHISADALPPSALNATIPHSVDAICAKAMAKDPAARYQTASEMIDAITHLDWSQDSSTKITKAPKPVANAAPPPTFVPATMPVDSRPTWSDYSPPVDTEPPHPGQPAKSKRRTWPIIAVVVTVLLASVGGILAWQLTKEPTPKPVDPTETSTTPLVTGVTIRGITYSTDLTELTITDQELTTPEIKQLCHMVNLTYLDLSNNLIRDLSSLNDLTHLWELRLTGNRISDVSPLAGLVNLRVLHLNKNQINEIEPLSELTKLTELRLSDNKVVNLTPLGGLTALKTLAVSDNEVVDLNPLSALSSLTELVITGNKVSDLSPLVGLPLNDLQAGYNQITDLTPLSELPLTNLSLSGNRISDLAPLYALAGLSYLSIASNSALTQEQVDDLQAALPDCWILYW